MLIIFDGQCNNDINEITDDCSNIYILKLTSISTCVLYISNKPFHNFLWNIGSFFRILIAINDLKHDPQKKKNKGRDGLMTVTPLSQSGTAMLRQLANRKGRRADGRLCPLRNFPSPRWLSHRETDRYSSEKPTHSPSIPVLLLLFFLLFCISSSPSLRHPHIFFSPLSFSDGIEMLHLRSTVALKDLFHTQLKRPLAGRLKAAAPPAASACFSTGGGALDARWFQAVFSGWSAPPRPAARRAGVRGFCSKGDGHSDAAKESEK